MPLYIDRTGAKPGTIRLREYNIRKLLHYFAHIKIKDITEEAYQVVLNDLKDQGLAKITIEGVHTTAKLIFKMAVSRRLVKINPTENAYIKRDPQVIIESDEEDLPKYFEKEELALFLDTIKENGLFMDDVIFMTLAYTGMRVGELVALKWGNIDFRKNIIHITKTYYNPKNNTREYQILPLKTRKSRRKIMVDETIMKVLEKYKAEQDKIVSRLGASYNDKGYVFANFNRHPGYPILIKLIASRMARLLERSGLSPNLTPHSLRHTHTSLLAEAGVGLEVIMDRLGHQDDEVTRNVYLHVTNEMKRDAADNFGNLMRGLK